MRKAANIYLIGPRACGKTTLGRLLAARLKRPFVDTDRRIRLATGQTVAELVEAGGWEGFRQAEAEALADVALFSGQVVSCGGGIVLREENRETLAKGLVLYLRAEPEVLAARLAHNPETAQRPSLTGASVADEVRQVLAERAPLYEGLARETLPADLALPELVERALAAIARLERW